MVAFGRNTTPMFGSPQIGATMEAPTQQQMRIDPYLVQALQAAQVQQPSSAGGPQDMMQALMGGGGGSPPAGMLSQFMGQGGAGAGAGASGGAGGGGASGASGALGAAGPWALLAAAIIGNETMARKGGRRDENKGKHALDLITGRVLEQDMDHYGDKVGGIGGDILKGAGRLGNPVGTFNLIKKIF